MYCQYIFCPLLLDIASIGIIRICAMIIVKRERNRKERSVFYDNIIYYDFCTGSTNYTRLDA